MFDSVLNRSLLLIITFNFFWKKSLEETFYELRKCSVEVPFSYRLFSYTVMGILGIVFSMMYVLRKHSWYYLKILAQNFLKYLFVIMVTKTAVTCILMYFDILSWLCEICLNNNNPDQNYFKCLTWNTFCIFLILMRIFIFV